MGSLPMAESKKTATNTASSFDLSLEEFCARQSQNDTRVELISGFYRTELRQGHLRDSHAAYAERLAAFENAPVN